LQPAGESVKQAAQSRIFRRFRIRVAGIVQGVGFRPFVYNLAREYGISGFVGNDSDGVFIEAQGDPEALAGFVRMIREGAPPLAEVDDISWEDIALQSRNGFHIRESVRGETMGTLISPDMAICSDCAEEMDDPLNRRYLYPFINCTNCGPRYSIIRAIPYDRPKTSMRDFEMCPDCRAEYDNPGDRRFHAQPNACEACGPWVTLYDAAGRKLQENGYAMVLVNKMIHRGHIVAVKGLGGFHLACDAHHRQTVERLRERKNREEKPLAVMAKDLDTAEQYVHLSPREKELLLSPRAPVVLAEKRPDSDLHDAIAPGNPRLGVMLPYTPLHKLLFHSALDLLVMTSGNYSEEPICIGNQDARERLKDIADEVLVHNRRILQRVDDSVVVVLRDRPRLIRRSRGYVPRPIGLLHQTPPILAVGAELKNTLAYSRGSEAFLSQHIGDLSNVRAMEFFHQTRDHLAAILEIEPSTIAYDLHPGYRATRWALDYADQTGIPAVGVQHHHAHMAAAMAEHGLDEPVIGIVLDGTGYGTDGCIWGGEVLLGDYGHAQRFARFEYLPMPGGDKAVREPWRMGLAYLRHTFGPEFTQYVPAGWQDLPVAQVAAMIDKSINAPLTSSCGRLFDGVAAICGGRTHISFQGQAAMEFQHRMGEAKSPGPLAYEIVRRGQRLEIKIAPVIRSVIDALREGADLAAVSRAFHEMLTDLFVDLAIRAREESRLGKVVLSGGVFQNTYLFQQLSTRLENAGFQVYLPGQVPANDGGISLGQLAVAQAVLAGGMNAPDYREM